MSPLDPEAACPCDLGAPLERCCGRYLACVATPGLQTLALASMNAADPRVTRAVNGDGAPTAVALMRSRYTAFVLRDAAYLLATWATSHRPAELDLGEDINWVRLLIQDTVAGGEADATGIVEFTAVYRDAGGRGTQRERSSFTREGGRWVYVEGQLG